MVAQAVADWSNSSANTISNPHFEEAFPQLGGAVLTAQEYDSRAYAVNVPPTRASPFLMQPALKDVRTLKRLISGND